LELLERLSYSNEWVRRCVAGNLSAPPVLLERLLQDLDLEVAQAAADNPNLPKSVRAMWQLAH
jgi:hypothetical protein